MPRRPSTFLVLLVVPLVLGACGNKKSTTTVGDTEGTYLDVGPLKYQVQISRELNPKAVEDVQFLKGIAPSERTLKPDEVWFAVFVRVENETKHFQRPATDYSIHDTEGNAYTPLTVSKSNPFAYNPVPVRPNNLIPLPDSVAAQTSIGGEMLLFKFARTSLENRPLRLIIKSPAGPPPVGTVDLDV
jgi:hypothetical protein